MPGIESDYFGDSGFVNLSAEESILMQRARIAREAGRFADLTLPETERALVLMDAFGVELTVAEQEETDHQRWLKDRDAAV